LKSWKCWDTLAGKASNVDKISRHSSVAYLEKYRVGLTWSRFEKSFRFDAIFPIRITGFPLFFNQITVLGLKKKWLSSKIVIKIEFPKGIQWKIKQKSVDIISCKMTCRNSPCYIHRHSDQRWPTLTSSDSAGCPECWPTPNSKRQLIFKSQVTR